jgi:hypothetical protein
VSTARMDAALHRPISFPLTSALAFTIPIERGILSA